MNLSSVDVEPADFEKDDDYNFHVCFPRFEVLRCLHFLGWTRGHLTMTWVLSVSISSNFGPFPVNTMLRAGDAVAERRDGEGEGGAGTRGGGAGGGL